MIRNIKVLLVALVVISLIILAVLFLQDRTKKLEDRKYNDINIVYVNSDNADINIMKSDDESVRVVIYGTSKDFVELVEGSNYLNISKLTGNNRCFLNCKNEINIYVPFGMPIMDIKTENGNVEFDDIYVKNITIKSDIGNISIDKTNVINIESNVGNVLINEIDSIRDSSIKTDIGNVEINKIINLKIDAKSETGSVVIPLIREEQDFTLKIESNIGNIDIDKYESKSK